MYQSLQHIEAWLGRIGSHRLTGLATIMACAAICLWFGISPPPPGYAVACLAGGAVVMTFQKLSPAGKCLWLIFGLVMVVSEIRAIGIDRDKQDHQHKLEMADQEKTHTKDQRDLNTQFEKIVSDNRKGIKAITDNTQLQFDDTEHRFALVISQERYIRSLSAKNLQSAVSTLNYINGADAMPVIIPMISGGDRDNISTYLWNIGKSPLTGTHFTVDVHNYMDQQPPGILDKVEIGTISPRLYRKNVYLLRLTPGQEHGPVSININGFDVTSDGYEGEMVTIFTDSQAGSFSEDIQFRRKIAKDSSWTFRFMVFKKLMVCDSGKSFVRFSPKYAQMNWIDMSNKLSLPGHWLSGEEKIAVDRVFQRDVQISPNGMNCYSNLFEPDQLGAKRMHGSE